MACRCSDVSYQLVWCLWYLYSRVLVLNCFFACLLASPSDPRRNFISPEPAFLPSLPFHDTHFPARLHPSTRTYATSLPRVRNFLPPRLPPSLLCFATGTCVHALPLLLRLPFAFDPEALIFPTQRRHTWRMCTRADWLVCIVLSLASTSPMRIAA